ncbi:patatin-like phospholipase family protein [Vibrio olivae]|uniref:Patatin-like phospholipase family protein n=1 Tax=Vibrio olivae TaxID=1243002 RepID=A0ABV5HJT9_9VIBR
MFKIMTLLILFASIVGCSSKVNNTYNDLVSPDLTKTKRQAEYKTSAPTLGIAFGGGGVRGFMHLGVIKALKEANIHANVVTGVSAGSIAAVFYASGMDYQHLENTINNVEMSDVLDITLSSRGFIDGARLSDWINSQVKQSDLTQMPIPIGLVATNLSQQKSMLITKGNPGHAVQASSSIPGAFIPVENQGNVLVDGGLLDVVPVNYTRELGADVVIGVDIYCGNQAAPSIDQSGMQITFSSFRMLTCKLSEADLNSADILIQPNFDLQSDSEEEKQAAINAGYMAAKAVLPKIRHALLSQKISEL